MGKFTLTQKAKADLKSIAVYTQRTWGKEQRNTYLHQFDDAFHVLSDSPAAGSECDFIKKGYRKFPVSSHLIFYRSINQSEIEIVRILHKRMDVKEQIKKT
jgi:toxin ParE1/3/4